MIRLSVCLRDNYEDSFYIDNIERVEVDCVNNLFTRFRIWSQGNIKEISDNLNSYFTSHDPTIWLNSCNDNFITVYSSQGSFFPYLLTVFSTHEDLISIRCLELFKYNKACSLVFGNYELTDSNFRHNITYRGDLEVQGINIYELNGIFEIQPESRIGYLNYFPFDYTIEITKSDIKDSNGKFVNAQFFEEYPEQKEVFGAVYCLKMYEDDELFYKIGITRKKADFTLLSARQIYYENAGYQMQLEAWMPCSNFYEAWLLEQELLKKYKKYTPIRFFEGHTECLTVIPDELKNV